MSRPAAHALWRAAPGRLLRTPGWFGLVLVAAALLVASIVAPSLFVASARATALEAGLSRASGLPYGGDSADLRVTWTPMVDARSSRVVQQALDDLPVYGDPVVTATGIGQNGVAKALAVNGTRTSPAVLWYRDGALPAVAGGAASPPGVWLPAATARELGLEVGDNVRIGLDRLLGKPFFPRTTLAGTYETVPGSTMPTALAKSPDADRIFLPSMPERPGLGTPLAITDRATFDRLEAKAGDTPFYVADMPLPAGVTAAQARTAVAATKRLGIDAYDPSTQLGEAMMHTFIPPAQLEVVTGLPVIVEHAAVTATQSRDQVRPYALAGRVLAVVVLVAAWVLLAHSRRREQVLLSGLGLRPGAQSVLAMLEVLLAALLAAPVGVGLALLGLRLAGPGGGAVPTYGHDDRVRTLVAVAGVVVLVGAAALVLASGIDRTATLSRLGRVRRPLPWALALLAVTGVVAATVYAADVHLRTGMGLTVALPLLVVASVAVLVTRALAWLRPRLRQRPRAGSPRWLAGRRSATVAGDVVALSTVIAVALGIFGYTLTVRRGIVDGIDDKTASLAGAGTTVGVGDGLRGAGWRRAVQQPVPGSTVVWSRGVSVPPAYGDDHLMAIDPPSFVDVADWGSTGALADARRDLRKLDWDAKGLPVIVVGDTRLRTGDHGTFDFSSSVQVPFVVVGTAAAFPGASVDGATTTYVVGARRLFKLLPRGIDPRARGASAKQPGAFASTVWSGGTPSELKTALRTAGIDPDGAVDTADAESAGAGLVASSWAAAYALALGVVVLVLALAAVMVLALRLADRDRTSDVLLRRMGYRPRELARSRVWEGSYAVVSAALVAAVATAVLVRAPSTIDAVATVPPVSGPRPGAAELLTCLVVVAAMILLVWVLSTWRATRDDGAEVLRGGD